MARICGPCSLCCRLEKITELHKPRYVLCSHCVLQGGNNCSIYAQRPASCSHFKCSWLIDETKHRPDLAHLYAVKANDGVMRVMVDPAFPQAWQEGLGKEVVETFVEAGFHVLVLVGLQITFLPGRGKPMPEKLLLDWVL